MTKKLMRPRRNNPWFALPSAPPAELTLRGARYRLTLVFKHDFFAATCLYELLPESRPADALERVVVKFGRLQDFLGLPMRWLGELNRDHEEAMYAALAGVEGVPRWGGRVGEIGYAIEYVQARPMDHQPPPPPGFFDRLRRVFEAIHARGVAYVDSNKRSNILIRPDGSPVVIDFQISVRRRDDLPWPMRQIVARVVAYLQAKDIYHLYKHKRRLSPQELRPEEEPLSRHRGGLHGLHRAWTKPYRAVRRAFLRAQYQKGQLVSPTAELEDHNQPEKETWRST